MGVCASKSSDTYDKHCCEYKIDLKHIKSITSLKKYLH